MRVSNMPGGIGAVAHNTVVANRPGKGGTIVAYLGVTFLTMAIGRYAEWGAKRQVARR